MVLPTELIEKCAPEVSPVLMQALVRIESAGRPFAIGMDRAQGTVAQPRTLQEAVATARRLAAAGRRFSVGLAQIHVSNVSLYGLSWEQAFDACQNLQVGQRILRSFFHRATASGYSGTVAVWAALRGYNSGGMHRSIGNDYASRIFAYMSSAPPSVQLGRGVLPQAMGDHQATLQDALPAIPATPNRGRTDATARWPAPLAPATQTTSHPGESLDIFQKSTVKAGF